METFSKLIEETEKEFGKWQNQRKPGEKIPVAIWDSACKCAIHYGGKFVADKLRLNSGQLAVQTKIRYGSTKLEETNSNSEIVKKDTSTKNPISVTKIVAVEASKFSDNNFLDCEIVSPEGWILKVKGTPNLQIMQTFIETINLTRRVI